MQVEQIKSNPINYEDNRDERSFILNAVRKANDTYDYWKENFENAEMNMAYLFGEQYTKEELQDKSDMNRVALTFNKLPQFINKVVGSQRSTVNTIKTSPTGAAASKEEEMILGSGEAKKISQIYTDIIRDIEYQSNAKAWYKTAFKQALEGGFGWLRVLTEYQEDGFDVDVKISGIRNRWSVLADPRAREADLSDMNFCFISEEMPRKEFEARYPDKGYDVMPGAGEANNSTFWAGEDMVIVTEYFWREPAKKIIMLGSDGNSYVFDEVEGRLEEMAANGIEMLKTRTVDSYKVKWVKMTQSDILEEEREFPTSTIPIVPVLGRVFSFKDKERYRGLIDDAIDAQRALNKMRSSAVERIDASPITPFVASDKAIEGYEDMWAEANSTKFATLVYRKGEERPIREQGATMPTAELQTSQYLDDDMKSSIGIFNASLGSKSNETSGRAIEARRAEADIGTFEFIDNYNNAIRRIGILTVELIPKVYDTNRVLTLRTADERTDTIEVNKPQEGNRPEERNTLHSKKYSVVVSSGQSYQTKQQENADQILELMKVNENIAQAGSDLLVKNLDFADSDTLSERLEKTIPLNLLSKEKREERQEEQGEPQPTPEEKIAQMEMQMKEMEIQSSQTEAEFKIQIEQLKLDQAKVALETKKAESDLRTEGEARKVTREGEKRKDDIANGIVDQMKKPSENQSTPPK